MSDLDERMRLAAVARERLGAALDSVRGEPSPPAGGDAGERAEAVRVDAHALVGRCPRRTARPADDYQDSVATVRRRIGLLALRHAAAADPAPTRGGVPLASAVDAVLADTSEWFGMAEWFTGLDRAGRVAVRAAALTWCTDVRRLVGVSDRIKWADPFQSPRWRSKDGSVHLRASVDAVLGTPRDGEKLLVISDAPPGPGERLRAGHVAVVHALTSGRVPVRVSIGSPASGQVRPHGVDEALVEVVVDRIAAVVGHFADVDAAPAEPGPWCAHCHLRDACEEGLAHLAGRSLPRSGERQLSGGDPTM